MAPKKKIYLIASIAIAATIITTGVATVQASTINASNHMDNIVNAIATKFNLKSSDVQKVFDEQRSQMQTQRQQEFTQKFADKIKEAVNSGKLTQDQANKITAKKAEIDIQIKNLDGKTGEERQTAMKSIMDSFKQWASDNNIPTQYIMMGGGMGKGHGGFPGDFNGRGKGCANSSSTSQN